MDPPSAFSAICTHHMKDSLLGLLFSLSVHHPMAPVYLFLDTTTNSRVELVRRYLKLRLHITVNMDAWPDTKRVMQRDGTFDEFLSQRMLAMDRAFANHPDVCCIDVDLLFLGPLLVDKSRALGVSEDCRIGGFGYGLFWTKNRAVPQRWIALHHESSERSVNALSKEFSHFVFGEECNLGWWRVERSTEPVETMMGYFEQVPKTNVALFKKKPIVVVHSKFASADKAFFNTFIFNFLMQCKRYKECAILQRVMHGEWILNIPKQPAHDIWKHNGDGFREMVRIWEREIPDLRLNHSSRHLNCFIEPNICVYDRPGNTWLVPEVHKAPLVLMNGLSKIDVGGDLRQAVSWIAYYKHPMVLEDFIKQTPLSNYDKRTREFVFTDSFDIDSEMSCREKLVVLANCRFGVCTKKTHTKRFVHVELLATGTVPVVDHEQDMSPLKEDVHYIVAKSINNPIQTIRSLNNEQWTRMSEACKDWYATNAHSSVSWERTLRRVLYDEECV